MAGDAVVLEYEDCGAGEPVVFIHGAFIVDVFRPLLWGRGLADRYRLISYHRRGHGGSSRTAGPTSLSEQACDCRRLLSDLGPKEETRRSKPWWVTLRRLTLAALVIIAAAGRLWRTPVGTAISKLPLALLVDGGFPAGGTWDARMRTADDLMARAETDDRGVALIRLSDPTRDISLETPAAARVRIKQFRPQPYAVERADALPALGRFLDGTPDAEIVWLSDGVDLGGGSEFVAASRRLVGRGR